MRSPLALVALVLLLAGGFAFWFLYDPGAGGAADTGPEGPNANAEAATDRVSSPGSGSDEAPETGPKPGALGQDRAALERWLKEHGQGAMRVPENHGLLVAEVVWADPADPNDATEGAEAKPVLAATMTLNKRFEDGSTGTESLRSAQPNAEGRLFTTLPLGGRYTYTLTAEGGTTRQGSLDIDAALVDLGRIVMQPQVSAAVAVTTGVATLQEPVQPLPGMALRVLSQEGEVLAQGETGQDGRMQLPPLDAGTVRIIGEIPPYARIDEERTLDAATPLLSFSVERVGALRLRVLSDAGAPMANFQAALDIQRSNQGAWMMPYFSEYAGQGEELAVTIEGIKEGKYDIFATSKGFALGQGTVQIVAGETSEAEVRVARGATLEGTVTGPDGDGLAGAIVFSERDLIPSTLDPSAATIFHPMARAATTDAQGRFRIEDLSEGSHKVTAGHQDYAEQSELGVRVTSGDTSELEIALIGGGTLTGYVYDEMGQPAAGDQVMALNFMDRKASYKRPQMTTVGADGSYRIENIPPGGRGVIRTFARPRPGVAPYEMKMVRITDGETSEVNFGEVREGATVRGTVTRSDGEPATGAVVMLIPPAAPGVMPEFLQTSADREGLYVFDAVPGGRYTLSVAKPDRGSDFSAIGQLNVPASGFLDHDITLPGGRLEGRVLSAASGEGLARGEVVLMKNGTEFYGRLELEPGGAWSLDNVVDGTYLLLANAEGHASASVPSVTVRDGATVRVPDIELSAGGSLVLTVLDAAGEPLAGAGATLADPSTGEPLPTWALVADERGRITVSGIPAGDYLVLARSGSLRFDPVRITIDGGETTTAESRAAGN